MPESGPAGGISWHRGNLPSPVRRKSCPPPARDQGGQPAKVFIASTSEDLKAHREAARNAAIAAGMLPVMMEDFTARGDNPPLPVCLSRVSETNLLVVIVAHRYGWVPSDQPAGQHKSITWLECEQAVTDGKEVLAFVLDEKHRWPETGREAYRLTEAMQNGSADEALFQEVNRNVALLKEFKGWLSGRGIRATFTTPENLRRCVAEALNDWRQRRPAAVPVEAGTKPPAKPPAKPLVPPAYLEWLLARCGEVELMGLELKHGSGVRLNHVYTPLATSSRPDGCRAEVSPAEGNADRAGTRVQATALGPARQAIPVRLGRSGLGQVHLLPLGYLAHLQRRNARGRRSGSGRIPGDVSREPAEPVARPGAAARLLAASAGRRRPVGGPGRPGAGPGALAGGSGVSGPGLAVPESPSRPRVRPVDVGRGG